MDLKEIIRDVPDFPKAGILFKDITPLLADAGALRAAIEQLAHPYRNGAVDLVVGIESRGFILGLHSRANSAWALCRSANPASCQQTRFLRNTSWNTEQIGLRFTRTQSPKDKRSRS